MNSLKPRLLTAAIGIPVAVVIMLLTELWHPLAGIIIGLMNAVMVYEYFHAAKLNSCLPLIITCMLFSLALPILIITPYWYIAVFLFMLAAFSTLIAMHTKLSYTKFCFAVFGTLLISFGMSAFALAVNSEISSTFFFAMMLLLPWTADGGAYFAGSMLGKHKLCPKISPKKTVEGAVGGMAACLLAAVAMGLIYSFWIIRDYNVNFAAIIITAILDSVISILGDLSFSLIKRHFGIKDYGSVFPGHGGVLDRFDSIIFTAPVVIAVGQLVPFFTAA